MFDVQVLMLQYISSMTNFTSGIAVVLWVRINITIKFKERWGINNYMDLDIFGFIIVWTMTFLLYIISGLFSKCLYFIFGGRKRHVWRIYMYCDLVLKNHWCWIFNLHWTRIFFNIHVKHETVCSQKYVLR